MNKLETINILKDTISHLGDSLEDQFQAELLKRPLEYFEEQVKYYTWTPAQKEPIMISDMTTSHLVNTLYYFCWNKVYQNDLSKKLENISKELETRLTLHIPLYRCSFYKGWYPGSKELLEFFKR